MISGAVCESNRPTAQVICARAAIKYIATYCFHHSRFQAPPRVLRLIHVNGNCKTRAIVNICLTRFFLELAMHLQTLITALIALAATTFSVAGAIAQTQAPAGPAVGASAASSAPGRGPGPRAGGDDPPGWAMMNSQERREHRTQLRNAKTAEECRDIVAQHHRQMIDRAQSLGRTPPPEPRRDPCAGLKQ
jgi:hypothetical protein